MELHRRRAIPILLLAAGIAAPSLKPSVAAAQSPAAPLQSEFVFELVLDVDPAINAGAVRVSPITGGTFEGPNIKGTVHAGGADWVTQDAGHSDLNCRIVLETDDGALIAMTYTGVVARGDSGTYWEVRPVFHTASDKYAWLNQIVAVGKSRTVSGKVAYDVFRTM